MIMSKKDEQIARMKGLMTYGVGTPKKTQITESMEGADGNVYAIIREGSKFYIKSTPKGSELVAESFNYIGGFMNRKNNEFSSYNQASKNLELKLRSLNEAYGVNKPVEVLNPDKKEVLMVEMTDAMKASIARYRQIMSNAAGIMSESSTISASNTGNPEAPKTTSFSAKLGEPFTNTAEATLDKDLKKTASDPEKQGEPFGDNEKAEEYTDAQYVPDGSVANKKPSGGKVVRVNENEEYEETIEECDEWGSCGVPCEGGVGEVGDDAPFTQGVAVNEDAESFVGFANDEDDVYSESDDKEDIDLDDMDIDLDSDDMDEEEIDDIDTEESLEDIESDDIDDETSIEDEIDLEDDEISALRSEIEELRSMVEELMNNDEEEEYELEIGSDDFDEEDDFEDEEDFEDEPSVNESYNLTESKLQLPFDYKVHWDELSDIRGTYGVWLYFKNLCEQRGGTPKDLKTIFWMRGRSYEALECDYELRACKKNMYLDEDTWETLLETLDSLPQKLRKAIRTLSFVEKTDMIHFDNCMSSFESKLNSYYDFFDTKVCPPSPLKDEYDDEDDVDIEDVDVDNIGFEGDNAMSDDEMDASAWANIDNDKHNSLGFGDINDSVKPRRINENGTRLNVFGKHPGYRKKVMSLPATGSDKGENVRDWNDESVYSEEPFGSKIGTSEPFEEVINKTVESIMESLKKKI